MPIMKWKWSISSKYEVLSLEKVVQIRGVIPHYLTHMVQSVALKKGIHEEIVRLEWRRKSCEKGEKARIDCFTNRIYYVYLTL
jgi:hypothetical protein